MYENMNDKYNIKPEDNIPQIVYGVPDFMLENNELDLKGEILFNGFVCGYHGPSKYYYIEKIDEEYRFKYGYDKYGRIIDKFDNDYLKIAIKSEEDYKTFIKELKRMTSAWDKNYVNDIMDGTQWQLELKEANLKFNGSNKFPNDFGVVMNFIAEVFEEKKSNYDIYNKEVELFKEGKNKMSYEYINEDTPSVINNEYDYSNILPTSEGITFLVQYCEIVYKHFLALITEDEKRNEQFKYEYKNYNYKKTYSDRFEIYIRKKSYNNLTCKDFVSFQSAINDGNLKNVSSLEIKMDLNFKRGQGTNLTDHENSYTIIFKPYEITFARKSSHNEALMNQIENNIKEILNKFPIANTIFCTK